VSLEDAAGPVGDTGDQTVDGARRRFVANLVLTVAGFLGLGGLAARFLQYLYPVVPPEEVVEVHAGRRDSVAAGGGLVLSLPTGQIALVDAGGELRAFSAVCTHLGCIVRWETGMEHLYCACHGGMFDRAGQVVGGPQPRPLPRHPLEVREGQVFVKIKIRPRTMSV
jgi:cytochrome b6-f complex iron-sulfur subunit